MMNKKEIKRHALQLGSKMRSALVILCLLLSAMAMQPAASAGFLNKPRAARGPPGPRPPPPPLCCGQSCCHMACC